MRLWQEILSDFGDDCYFMSFEELADDYETTPRAIGKAIAAIRRRKAMCGTVEYANGKSIILSTKTRAKKRTRKINKCGCQ